MACEELIVWNNYTSTKTTADRDEQRESVDNAINTLRDSSYSNDYDSSDFGNFSDTSDFGIF